MGAGVRALLGTLVALGVAVAFLTEGQQVHDQHYDRAPHQAQQEREERLDQPRERTADPRDVVRGLGQVVDPFVGSGEAQLMHADQDDVATHP